MAVTGQLQLKISTTHTSALDLSTPSDTLSVDEKISISSAVGANYPVDQVFHDQRTLADGADETLDLTASLTDVFGNSLSFSNLKGIYIKNNSNDANLLVGAAAASQLPLFNDSSDILKIPPQGIFYQQFERADGLIVSTNDKLKIAHDGTGSDSLTYDIVLVGHTTQPTPTPTPTATPTPTPSPSPTPTPTPT